jgi:hypothetical protein
MSGAGGRITLLPAGAFWLVMGGLLWRTEYGIGTSAGRTDFMSAQLWMVAEKMADRIGILRQG